MSLDGEIKRNRDKLEELQHRLAAAEKDASKPPGEKPAQDFEIPAQTQTYQWTENKTPAPTEPPKDSPEALMAEIEKLKFDIAVLEKAKEAIEKIALEGRPTPAEVDRHKPDEFKLAPRQQGLADQVKEGVDLLHGVAGTPADYGPAVVKVPDAYTGPEVGLMVAAVLVEAGQKKIPEAAEKMAAEAEMVAKGVKATADQIELNAGVGVLMAEQKLQETQEQLKKDAVLTEINVAYGKKQAKDTIAEVKDKIEEVKDKISEGWDKVVESANKAMDKAAEIVMTSLGDPDAQKMYEGHVKQMKTELQDLQSAYNTRVQMAKSMPETQATDFMGKVADAAKAHIEAIQKQQETERERARSIDPRHRQDYTL